MQAPPAETSSRSAALVRRFDVLIALVQAELRDQRELSPVGMVKWLLEPALYAATYYVLVATILRRGEPAYVLFLLCALLPWRYIQSVIGRGMSLVQSYGRVISDRVLPAGVLPLALVVSDGIVFTLTLLLLAPLMAVYDAAPTLALLWLPVLIGVLVTLVAGVAYAAALVGVFLPDYRSAVSSATRVVFLMSTALFSVQRVPGDNLVRFIRANPVSGVFDSFRAVIIEGGAPAAFDVLYPLLVGVVLLAVAGTVYVRLEPDFPREV